MIGRRDFLRFIGVGIVSGMANPLLARACKDEAMSNHAMISNSLKYLPSGIKPLDEKTGGFSAGSLTIIAGRPSMGKTALALKIAKHAGKDLDIPVGIFSLEQSGNELLNRMASSEANVDSLALRRGFVTETDMIKLSTVKRKYADIPIFIKDTANISLNQLREEIKQLKTKYDVRLIIVDYLQLINYRDNVNDWKSFMPKVTRALKEVATELKISIILLSQLPHWIEDRTPPVPELNDLKYYGNIAGDTDNIMFLYRKYIYSKTSGSRQQKEVEIIIAKSHNGSTGIIKTTF